MINETIIVLGQTAMASNDWTNIQVGIACFGVVIIVKLLEEIFK